MEKPNYDLKIADKDGLQRRSRVKKLSEIFKRKKQSIPVALGSGSGLSIPSPIVP